MKSRKLLRIFGGILSCFALSGALALPASAQDSPNRPIRFIVPNPAGGGTDTFARHVGASVSDKIGQPVVGKRSVGLNLARV